MTPDEERKVLNATAAEIDADIGKAFDELVALIRSGVPPRDAVDQVLASFSGAMAETMAAGLTAMIGQQVGTAAAMQFQVGTVELSRKLYSQAQATGQVVAEIVRQHTAGFQDARELARQLYEGYSFRDPTAEPIRFSPRNDRLPRYLREALLQDGSIKAQVARAFAGLQVDKLRTDGLRAAYDEALEALDKIQAGAGAKRLEKRLEIAFYERMRYFANRIAQTELHRAYANREAAIIMADRDIEFVQVRRAPGQGEPCICVLYTGRNLYGLGPGVYPKADAPLPPYHPHCRCVTSPRLDLTGRKAKPMDEEGDRYFLRRLGSPMADRIVGSQAKLVRVMAGDSVYSVVNANVDPAYRTRTMAQAGMVP